ncbi:MAG TPA: M81 family metallopeptidase [Thermomicrobiaceae bacterium]|nr:M81 family metallopeptidase [Thermomicrobiaceae bacterium]
MRVAIGGISHESSTFATVPTRLADFEQRSLVEGDDLIDRLQGTRTPVGGFLDAARDAAFEVVPTIFASATPGGPVTAEATETLTRRLVAGLGAALASGPLDGVLLALHGAMVSELDDDGESYVLRAVREVVGPDLPVIVTLDLHGNITEEMVALATIAVAYDEYPHTDPYERGYEAGLLMARVVRGGAHPTAAIVKLPLLPALQRQYTHAEPMQGVKRLAHEIEHEPGILNVSYLPGFPWADIVPAGFSVIVTSDDDPGQARDAARRLAGYVWGRRDEFVVRPVPVDEAVRRAMAAPAGPIVLADIGDNPGGGAPADGTVLLEALLRLGATNAVVVPLNDAEAAREAFAAGVGGRVALRLGGKVDTFHGEPLAVTGRVVRLSDGRFVHTGPMSTGVEMNMGPTALLELEGERGGRVEVVVSTYRYQPTDLEVLRSQGIEPTAKQIIAVKSSVHFRAAFTPVAREIVEVDTPGLTSPKLETLEFRKLTRPIYPLDPETSWSAG